VLQLWILVRNFLFEIDLNFDILTVELMTTPQLHYAVRCYNDNGQYGHYTEAGYFDKLCTAFQNLIEVIDTLFNCLFEYNSLDDTICETS
jgi:hypothetical protein